MSTWLIILIFNLSIFIIFLIVYWLPSLFSEKKDKTSNWIKYNMKKRNNPSQGKYAYGSYLKPTYKSICAKEGCTKKFWSQNINRKYCCNHTTGRYYRKPKNKI